MGTTMIALLGHVALTFVPAPQQPDPTPPAPRVIQVDANGWPLFDAPPAPASGAAPTGAPTTVPVAGPAAATPAPTSRTERPVPPPAGLALESPLRDVFERLGQPADFDDLGGIAAAYRIVVRDHRGAEVAVRELTHEFDARAPRRDRLLLPGRKVFGRDGEQVFAELHGLPMPSYESEARDQLDLFGVLARMPWVFADGQRFSVSAPELARIGPRELVRIRIEARQSVAAPPAPRFELWCAADSSEPVELRYNVAGPGQDRRVRLSEWRRVGAVRLPTRWTFVGPDDGVGMELEIARLDPGQPVSIAQFRPSR
jgi:hypothetical protein